MTDTPPPSDSDSTGWFIGIIVALLLFAAGYVVFHANHPAPAPAAPSSQVVDLGL
jgi:hypothetical protein